MSAANLKMQLIDNGFYLISVLDAIKLAGHLPRHGYEKLVVHEGQHYWLARTGYMGKVRWSIRPTNWYINGKVATLGGAKP